jgi:hypothetical protein
LESSGDCKVKDTKKLEKKALVYIDVGGRKRRKEKCM